MTKRPRQSTTPLLALLLAVPSLVVAQVSDDVRGRYIAARRLATEDSAQAWEAMRQLVTEEPSFAPAYRGLVEVSMQTERLPAAAGYFDDRIAADREDAYAHYGRGLVAGQMGDWYRAIESFQRARELRTDFSEVMDDRGGLAFVYVRTARLDEGLIDALAFRDKNPGVSAAHYGVARMRMRRGEWDDALEGSRRALELDPESVRARSLLFYGLMQQARTSEAVAELPRLKESAYRRADLDMESYAEMQWSLAFQTMGRYGDALRHGQESLRLARLYAQPGREMTLLNNLAAIYGTAGNLHKAEQYFLEVVERAEASGETQLAAVATGNVAHIQQSRGDHVLARASYRRALDLSRADDFLRGECSALLNLGSMEQQEDSALAESLLAEALECARRLSNPAQEGYTLEAIADLKERTGPLEEAVAHYRQALEIGERVEDVQILWDAEGGLASALEKLGRPAEALEHNLRAIAIYESVRASLDIDSVGGDFLNDKDEVYPSSVRLLAKAGRVEEAFALAERYKAKNLLDNLSRHVSALNELVPEPVRQSIQEIETQLRETRAAIVHARDEPSRRAELVDLEQKFTEAELAKAAVLNELRGEQPEFFRLTQPEPLGVAEVQSKVLGPGQALVEYVVGEADTSVFVVTEHNLHYELLPVGRDTIVEMMNAWSPMFKQRGALRQTSGLLSPALADFSASAAHDLYEVLFAPLAEWLPDGAELVVVPDDVTFYLPFEALVASFDDNEREDFDTAVFLLERYPVSYGSAASLLVSSERALHETAPATLLALGNPSFSDVEAESEPSGTLTATASYANEVLRDGNLVSLPHSEDEVRSIAGVLGYGASRVATQDEATEVLFKEEAAKYRILHLATHFLSNDENPLYSKLALASGGTDEDGFVEVYEVLGAQLAAELVVLSACNTGVGRLQRGEGLLGATRAFQYAGVPAIVVSLWSVEDQATASIMKQFYRHLKKGSNKRQALRQAKLDYLRGATGEKRDPFFWAPFVLVGDSRPMSLPASLLPMTPAFLTIVVLVIAIVASLAFLVRRALPSRSWNSLP